MTHVNMATPNSSVALSQWVAIREGHAVETAVDVPGQRGALSPDTEEDNKYIL